MPQMKPLLWLSTFLLTLSMLLLIISFMYFYILFTPSLKNLYTMSPPMFTWNWKW